jgi:hypothetical protein
VKTTIRPYAVEQLGVHKGGWASKICVAVGLLSALGFGACLVPVAAYSVAPDYSRYVMKTPTLSPKLPHRSRAFKATEVFISDTDNLVGYARMSVTIQRSVLKAGKHVWVKAKTLKADLRFLGDAGQSDFGDTAADPVPAYSYVSTARPKLTVKGSYRVRFRVSVFEEGDVGWWAWVDSPWRCFKVK